VQALSRPRPRPRPRPRLRRRPPPGRWRATLPGARRAGRGRRAV